MNIPAPQPQGDIPEVEDGIYAFRFNGIFSRVVEQFKTESNKFGKPDDGVRYDFSATILDEDRNPVLAGDGSDPDNTVDLRQAKSVPVISGDERSNSYFYMKGVLTPAEFASWLASTPENPVDLSHVEGRIVMAQVTHSPKGWPQIETFLGPAKPLKAAAKAE